jgi:hypothetical protein
MEDALARLAEDIGKDNPGMKGQILLIASVIVVLTYISLYYVINVYALLKSKASLEASLIVADEIMNIKREIEMLPLLDFRASDQELISHVKSFTDFVRRTMLARGKETGTASVLAYTPNEVGVGQATLNVSIFNQKLETMEDVKLLFSYGPTFIKLGDIPDGQVHNTSFTFNTTADVDYVLTVSYKTDKWGFFNESMMLPVRLGEKLRVLMSAVMVLGV